jgi:vWA-MoxR associated protein C-terminal domain
MRFDPDRVGVIAVGIEAYAFSDKNLQLKGPARHALEFVAIAHEAGVPMKNVRLFLSVTEPDTDLGALEIGRVRNAAKDLEFYLEKDLAEDLDCDLLYFYWCGHGAIDGELDRRLFYADADDVLYHNLRINRLLQYLHTSKFKHRAQVGFVDACAERVDLEAERLKNTTPLWVANDTLNTVPRSQFFYYAAAPWRTGQSSAGTMYFSRAVFDVLRGEPKRLLDPQPDAWRVAITAKYKELWPKDADDYRPVSFLEYANGHVRATVLAEGFNTAEQNEIRDAANRRGWSMEVAVALVKEFAVFLGRRDAEFCERLCALFRQITGLAISPGVSVAVRLLCGAMLEKKLEAFLAGLRELSGESASAAAFEILCQHADAAAESWRKAKAVGWSLAKWQALYQEWTDRDVPSPPSLELVLFESLNSYTKEDGVGVVYLAERAAQPAFLTYCRNRWPDAVPVAKERLKSRRQGNQNYITLEVTPTRGGSTVSTSRRVERAWYQAAGDPQPKLADQEKLALSQEGSHDLGARMYSAARSLRNRYFSQVDDSFIVLEVVVDAPLLLFDPDMFQCEDGDLLSSFNVVLRWRDRLDPVEDQFKTRENWEELAGRTWAQVLPTEKVRCHWLGWVLKNMHVRVRDHIQEAVRCSSPRSLLVGLQPDGDYIKLSRVLGASGAPFACWHVSPLAGGDVAALLGETILEELPHTLRKARLDPNGLEHLMILYDDPQRDPYRN